MTQGYHNANTNRSNGAKGGGAGAVDAPEAFFAGPVRLVKAGQERMSLGSAALLVKLAAGEGTWVSWRILKPFVDAFRLTGRDVEPLVGAGWLERKENLKRELAVRITDAGNEQVRGLVSWLQLEAEGRAVG